MRPALLDTLLEAQRSGRSVVLATRLSDGAQELVEIGPAGAREPRTIAGVSADQVYAALRAEEAQVAETADGPVLLRPYTVPRRLLVVGAVHIAQVLARTSPEVGLPATIIDPREGFATRERFPGAELVRAWPDQALERIGLDARSALVVLAHDPKIDDPALSAALESDAFYIGALGGRRPGGSAGSASSRPASRLKPSRASTAPWGSQSARAPPRKSPSPSWRRSSTSSAIRGHHRWGDRRLATATRRESGRWSRADDRGRGPARAFLRRREKRT